METFRQLTRRAAPDAPVSDALAKDWREMANDWATSWKEVLTGKHLSNDLLSGLTVAAVALPLNLALAVMAELPASAGLMAGAIGGVLAATFGGQKLAVTGPAAALGPMVLALNKQFGAQGVAAATLFIGVTLVLLSLVKAGRLARHVPESVLAGFTTGVGLKLLDQQIPEFLGFNYRVSEIAAMMHQPDWLHKVDWHAVVCGLTVAMMVVTLRPYRRVPAAILALLLVTFVSTFLGWRVERVGDVPSTFPAPFFPMVPDDQWLALIIATLPLALLAGVESLLSASVVDNMAKAKKPHNPSLELFGQGLANFGVGLFGGMPVTGVVVRSGLNVQSGAQTRLSSLAHGVFLGASVLLFSQQIGMVPQAALAGLLMVIGFRLLELKVLIHLWHESKVEALAFLIAAVGTVSGHLMLGLTVALVVHFIRVFLTRGIESERKQIAHQLEPGVRAMLTREQGSARKAHPLEAASAGTWLPHVKGMAIVPPTSFVHPKASVIGQVVLGDAVHIAAGASVRADEGTPFFIGSNSNVQDGVTIHALKEKRVVVGGESWAVYVGKNVSMAHGALVHGPCYVGDDTFIGFNAVVHDSVVGKNCFVGIGAVVVGVEVPDGRFVPHGSIIDSRAKVDGLPPADAAQHHFNEDVVDVNRGLAAAYHAAARANRALPKRSDVEAGTSWGESWGPATRGEF